MSDLIPENNQNGNGNGVKRFELESSQIHAGHKFYGQDSDSNSNILDAKKVIHTILRFKWLVLLFLIIGGALAWLYADTIDPTYESTGSILISAGSSQDDELSRIISQTTGFGTRSTIANEMQVLKSREFARQVAIRIIDQDPGDIDNYPLLWTTDENENIERASEDAVTNRIRRGLIVERPERDSEVLNISFRSKSRVEAAYVVNNAMDIYVESSTQENRRAAELTADFLEREKREVEQRLEQAERRLEAFMNNTGIVRMDEQASGIVSRQTTVEVELEQVKLELQSVNEAIENHEKRMNNLKPGLSEQFSEAIGPRIRNSQEQLARYEAERTMILTRNPGVREREQTPPRLKYLDEEIDRVKNDIRDLSAQLFTEDEEYKGMDSEERAQMVATIQTRLTELRIEQNQLQSRSEALEERKQDIDRDLNALPDGMMQLARLKRDVAMNEAQFLSVSQNYSEMSVLKESQFGFGRIIDSALAPNNPVSPNRNLIIAIGMMLGAIFIVGVALFYDSRDKTIKSMDQLSRVPLPLLASVPVLGKVSKKKTGTFKSNGNSMPQEMILLRDQKHFASEAIRRLKNNIVYQYGHTPPKTIAVTSAEKGDGKSTIASNLGVAFAQEGYKTLLLDVDFRRPKIHTYFGLENEPGIIDYLNGKIAFLKLFKPTDLKYLKVVSSGSETFQPANIVSNKNFKIFLEEVKEAFDVVIIDTPPFGVISDSTALLKTAESTILVTKYRKTNRGIFVKTLEELNRIGARVSGVVLNGYDYRKETGTNYGSGYYEAYYQNYEAYNK